MQLSIREAKARFSEAAAAAARGERVVVTKQGEPFVELVAARRSGGIDWDRIERNARELGLDGIELPPEFDDPAFSRKVLGLDD